MSSPFPKSANYDQSWINANLMGPNVLWLTESLCSRLHLRPGMRVMDLGCGKALSSIFLAREYDVQVWATDLWISPSDNWQRVQRAGVQERVYPIYAEARSLPYAHEFFDLIVSIDAYHYFGTDDLYLEYLVRFLKPDGQIGIVSPGFRRELTNDIPAYLYDSYTHRAWHSFHSPDWWRNHWEKSGLVNVAYAEVVPDAWMIWEESARLSEGRGEDYPVIQADGGALLTFSRVAATRRSDFSETKPLCGSP